MTRNRSSTGITPWIAGASAVAGFYAIVLAWRGAARVGSLSLQLPFLMSGAFAGLALIVLGAALLHIDVARRLAAEEREGLREVVEAAARTAIALRDARPPS